MCTIKNVHVSYKHRLQASVVSLSGLSNDLAGRTSKLVHLIAKHHYQWSREITLAMFFSPLKPYIQTNPAFPDTDK